MSRKTSSPICIIGETMLDKYTYGQVKRINPEAPVPILQVTKETFTLGGAGNTANNVKSLNQRAILISLSGQDEYHQQIINLCEKNNIQYYFFSDGRPTIIKHRFVALSYNQQLLRIDHEVIKPIRVTLANKIIQTLLKLQPNILIISDYAKGLATQYLLTRLKEKYTGKILVDPKPENIKLYKNTYLIKPNLDESQKILGIKIKNQDSQVERAGITLVRKYKTNVVITRGAKGSTLVTRDLNIFHFRSQTKEVYDVSGAGDTYIATLAYALNKGHTLIKAARLADRASSIVVSRFGVSTINLNELKTTQDFV